MKDINYLTIDGGGVKGIVPLMILAEVEERLDIQVNEHFKYMAGSSTGALIVGMLRFGHSPREILDIYMEMIPEIFNKKPLRNGIIFPKYSDRALNEAIRENMGNRRYSHVFGFNRRELMLPLYNWTKQKLEFFKSWEQGMHSDTPMFDMLRASASAQSYFKPWKMNGNLYIDSGNIVNNPSTALAVDVLDRHKDEKQLIKGVSFSTGTRNMTGKKILFGGGKIQWAGRTVSGNLMQQSKYSNYLTKHISELVGAKFWRIDPSITSSDGRLDDSSEENIKALILDTSRYIDNNFSEIAKIFGK